SGDRGDPRDRATANGSPLSRRSAPRPGMTGPWGVEHISPAPRYTPPMTQPFLGRDLRVDPIDAYIDPPQPRARAIITHGHADHARAGHGAVLATPDTIAIMQTRYGADCADSFQPLE